MRLLKTSEVYKLWYKSLCVQDGDIVRKPVEFPCYVYEEVIHWEYQYIKSDLLLDNTPVPGRSPLGAP